MPYKTFLTKIAEKSPVLIAGDRLFQIAGRVDKSNVNNHNLENANSINLFGYKFPIIPSAPLIEIETLDRKFNKDRIFDYKKSFIEGKLHQEIKSQKEIDNYLAKNKVLAFIIYELFPLFTENKEDIDNLLNGKSSEKSRSQDIGEIVRKEYKATSSQINKLKQELIGLEQESEGKEEQHDSDKDELDSLIADYYSKHGVVVKEKADLPKTEHKSRMHMIAKGNPLLILNGLVYTPSNSDKRGKQENDIQVMIANKEYSLDMSAPIGIELLERQYLSSIEKELRTESVDEFEDQLREIQGIRMQYKALEKIAHKNEHETGNIGFLKRDESYYFYIKIPKFAMKSPYSERYYKFNECRIATRINLSDGRIYANEPCIIERGYQHPFVPSNSGSFKQICLGKFEPTSRMKTTPEGIASYLDMAVNVILNGYIEGSHPHRSLDTDNFYAISPERAKKEGYLITNQHQVNNNSKEEDD